MGRRKERRSSEEREAARREAAGGSSLKVFSTLSHSAWRVIFSISSSCTKHSHLAFQQRFRKTLIKESRAHTSTGTKDSASGFEPKQCSCSSSSLESSHLAQALSVRLIYIPLQLLVECPGIFLFYCDGSGSDLAVWRPEAPAHSLLMRLLSVFFN